MLYIKKKRLESLMNEQKPFCKILKIAEVMAKKLSKKAKMAARGIFQGFLAITSAFFNILQNGFLLGYWVIRYPYNPITLSQLKNSIQ